RRGLQHVRTASAARPCYAQIVAFARQLRDVEERPAIMWISPGQNLFDVTFGIAIAVDANRLNTFGKLGGVAVGVSRRGGGDEETDTKRRYSRGEAVRAGGIRGHAGGAQKSFAFAEAA